jgi:hypothetical protein
MTETNELNKYLDEKLAIGAISFETDAQVRHEIRMRDADNTGLRADLDALKAGEKQFNAELIELAFAVGVHSDLGPKAIITGATAIVENLKKIIERKSKGEGQG